jgi:hypothetical protein
MTGEQLLPDFIVGGAPRSGTTWLAQALEAHPRIAMAMPLAPEPKVFLADEPAALLRSRYSQWFGPEHAAMVRGEKTTNYFESDAAPARVAAALPDVRMVFALREPVERAYSNWLWSRMNGHEELPFADAIEQEGRRADPLAASRPHARPHDYLTRARYGDFAQRWIDALGREQVGFFVYEEMTGADGEATLEAIQAFIGVEPAPGLVPTGLVNEARSTGEPLDPELRDRLRERVRPLVDELVAVTGLDVGVWGY